jgi:hypothetical protein
MKTVSQPNASHNTRSDHATPEGCPDCLVPKDLMRGILGQALGVPRDSIDLTYPSDSQPER